MSQLARQSVLVTGATGFVGRHLVPDLVAAGADVSLITRPNSSLDVLGDSANQVTVIEDSGDAEALERAIGLTRPEVCIHLATYYVNAAKSSDIGALAEANISFGMRVAHAFAQSGGQAFVYASTFSQHKNNADYNPTVLYAATKEAFADVLRYYGNVGAFKVLDIELFDTFGAGDPRPKIWNLLMRAADSGEPLDTTQGRQILSPIHVSDVVSAMIHAAAISRELPDGYHSFHALGPQPIVLQDAVALFEKVNDITIPVTWGAREYSGNEMFDLWAYGEPLPGWSPQVSLEDGFRELWETRPQ